MPDPPVAPPGVTPPSRPRGEGGATRFLTDILVELNLVEKEEVDRAVELARTAGKQPERLLLEQGQLTEDALSRAIAERYGLAHLDLSAFQVDSGAASLISASVAKRFDAVPVAFVDQSTLLVAMVDPANVLAVDDIGMLTGLEVRPAVASREDIATVISRLNRFDDQVRAAVEEEEDGDEGEVVDLRESADEAPVIKLVHSIIGEAVESGASDIHFEPDGRDLRVRFRIDGMLNEAATVPRRMVAGVISRIKIMADLDIAERRLPQDGRVALQVEGRKIDLRCVTLPSVHGESAVMRVLDKDSVVMTLDKLGMQGRERDVFSNGFRRAHGCTLVTGPTGSGKSTSLYAALTEISSPEKNVITIEDPVEYELPGITQIQVNPRAGLSFANGLRSMMRADPDVIMVGEIRDRETAQIAVEAALTGHLVLSTLHTNDAPTAVTRLIEMGIEPFLVASALDCVVAQRLARTLCSNCKERAILPVTALRDAGYRTEFDVEAYAPVGCARCNGSGYKGRIGLFEVMPVNEEIRNLIIERRHADEIAAAAMRAGMRRLRDDGIEKVRQGITSIAEVGRVTGSATS